MGKKHKKHHKSERRDYEDDDDQSQGEMFVEEKSEKPLKLVLKVGGSQTNVVESDAPLYSAEESADHHEKRHKHKKKKKKKSSEKERHRHEDTDEKRSERKREKHSRESDGEEISEPPAKKSMSEEDLVERRQTPQETSRSQSERLDDTVLFDCLDFLHKTLQRKDANGFFAYPVNDVIAPGYSSIIMNPMDLSSMKTKMDGGEYQNVMEYKRDFKLMCDNALTYNHPDTIYHKAAKKLLHQGMKLMSRDRLLNMRRSLPTLINLTDEDLGLDEDEATLDSLPSDEIRENKKKKTPLSSANSFEAVGDDMSPEEILESAQAAAKSAADKLTLRNPNSHIGFLRRQKDGSTSLQVLNPENSGIVSETEKVVNLGSLVGKLNTGTGGIPTFKEDRRNLIKPITYLEYGPFGTYCPSYDSSFSSLTKEESDLVLSTYGDETCAQYATSIQDYLDDCDKGTDIVKMVDNLLNIVTQGEHGKTKTIIEEKQKEREEKNKQDEKAKEEALKKQEMENAKKSPLTKEEDTKGAEHNTKDKLQNKLNETAGLLSQLEKAQYDRLGQKLPSHLAYVPGPSSSELQLADKLSKGLVDISKEARPGDVVSTAGVRKALGITLEPISQPPTPVRSEEEASPVLSNPASVSHPVADLVDMERDELEDFAVAPDMSGIESRVLVSTEESENERSANDDDDESDDDGDSD